MKLNFDLGTVTVTEFGVGRDNKTDRSFVAIPVDHEVQTALAEMVEATWSAMAKDENGPVAYEASEKHGSTEYLYVPLTDDLAAPIRELHQAAQLPLDSNALSDPSDVFCYFVRLMDKKKRKLTALRRATQFKGILKKRLVRLVSDSLKLLDDNIFKLDSDFDLLVDSEQVHILRPSGFEFAGKLQQAILDAVPDNVAALRKELKFVDFDELESYAGKHPRAARYLASIRGQDEMRNVDKSALKRLCKRTGVEIHETSGRLTISTGSEMGFLEVLDRRRYELELIKGKSERFRASSRQRLGT